MFFSSSCPSATVERRRCERPFIVVHRLRKLQHHQRLAWYKRHRFSIVGCPLHFAHYQVYGIIGSGSQHSHDGGHYASHGKVETIAVNAVHFTGKLHLQESHFPLVFEFDEFIKFHFPLRHLVVWVEVNRAVARQRNSESTHRCCRRLRI